MIITREPRYFQDFAVGQKIITPSRTVTETDVVNYCAISGNWHPLHADAEYVKSTMYEQRIVQGALVYTIALGLALPMPEVTGKTVANYGTDKLRFPKPLFLNDTIHVEVVVEALEDHRLGGLVHQRFNVINQNGELCSYFTVRQIVERKDTGTASS